ncbi:MAG TPA: hypothetical protein DD400_01575 [Rhodospirillaceae bacterium]|nr:hypothetical protein [Rhodospirillaceae bacterium]
MTQKNALIGHTGFVGGFLKKAMSFSDFFNSQNIEDIKGQSFDAVICAGISAVKWMANKEPEKDRQAIARLQECLSTVSAKRFIHISTVDVFLNPDGVDENSPVIEEGLHPYGLHRYQFENFVRETFSSATIMRFPALFGSGLRKNALYDLLHDNCLDQISRQGVFQWYDLKRLPSDIEKAQGLSLVHFPTEPLKMSRIIDELFPEKKGVGHDNPAARYNLHTCYAERFGGRGPYLASADEVMEEMRGWIKEERNLNKGSAS